MRQHRLEQFRAITRERALDAAEAEELDRLLYAQRQYQWRLPHRVVLLREKLRRLEAELLPEQARTVHTIQARIDRRRAACIEAELRAATGEPAIIIVTATRGKKNHV